MKFHVPDMSCRHCTATIEKAVKASDPAATIRADLPTHTAEIDTALAPDVLGQVLAQAGYPATIVEDGLRG